MFVESAHFHEKDERDTKVFSYLLEEDYLEMLEKIKQLLTVLDLPSGVIMGLYTLVIISMSIASFIIKRPIDSTILTAYGMVAGLFAIHKTTVATTSIVTNSTSSNDTPTPPVAQ